MGLHFPYAFRGSLPGSFEPRRRPWGRVLPASAAPSSLHLCPDGVQGVAYIGINGVIRGACGSLERSRFGIEVQGRDSRFSFQSCRWRPFVSACDFSEALVLNRLEGLYAADFC
jgi:hypothetical protein